MQTDRIRILVAFVAVILALLPAPARGQTVAQVEVVPPAIPDMFQFNTPTGVVTDRIVVAKFVVNDVASDLELRLLMPAALKDFKISEGNVAVNDPNNGQQIATLRLRDMSATEATANPALYRVVKMTVRFDNAYDFGAGQLWTIQAKPTAATVRYVGYWEIGTGESTVEALVTRPRLIEPQADPTLFATYTAFANPTNISFGDVHINLSPEYVPDRQWEFINVGPGTLSITAANPASAPAGAYTIENYPSPPLNVLPMGSFSRRITARPTALGPVTNVNVTLTATAADPLQLNLTNTRGIRLKSAVLFDLSGSMLDDKNGESTNVEDERKVYSARLAALELAELYEAILPDGQLSLTTYPNAAGTCPSSEERIASNEITSNIQAFRQHLDASLAHASLIRPAGLSALTPMAEGISRMYNQLSTHGQFERVAVFHFGDGQHNCDSGGSRPTPQSWYNSTTLQNAGIPFFTIPYGATGAGWLQTFQDLAANTGGTNFPADATDDLALQKQFKNALGKALDLDTLTDPTSSITTGQTKQHGVCVNETIQQVTFSVHWTAHNAKAIAFTLRDPAGNTITPATPASDNNVSYVSGDTYAGYVVRGARLAGSTGAGEWTLRLVGNTSTAYSYQVYAKDPTKVEPRFVLPGVLSPGLLTFRISDGNRFLQDVQVSATVSAPKASMNNFLAAIPISRELLDKVPSSIGEGVHRLSERKLYAITHFTKIPLPTERTTQKIEFSRVRPTDDYRQTRQLAASQLPPQTSPADLSYQAAFKDARFAGLYNFDVIIAGKTKLGACFQRHIVVDQWVDAVLTPATIGNAVGWLPPFANEFFDDTVTTALAKEPPAGYERRFIRFTPRDQFGNLRGIDAGDEIALDIDGAEKISGLQNTLDGSFYQLVQFRTRSNPNVRVTMGDVRGPEVSLQPKKKIPWWAWVLVGIGVGVSIGSGL